MVHPVFQPREDTNCDVCGHDLTWLRVVLSNGGESTLRDCLSCRWYEGGAMFIDEAYRKKLRNDSAARTWALKLALATGSAVELRRSPKLIESDEGNSIHELDLMTWLKRAFHDSDEMSLVDPPPLPRFWQWLRRLRVWWTKDETLEGVCTAKYIPYLDDQ